MKRSISGLSLARCVLPLALALAGMAGTAIAQEKPLPGLAEVLGELRRGGLVIYFRHSTTEPNEAIDQDLARCETQRNLSREGREQAVRIGKSIRDLRIPVGTVATSPFCRCVDTARLAFGAGKVDADLKFAMQTTPEETQRLAEALRAMLSTVPAKGTNKVIVAHTANLREAAQLWPKPEGAAYVFRPLGDGRFESVARIGPEEWSRVSHPLIAKN